MTRLFLRPCPLSPVSPWPPATPRDDLTPDPRTDRPISAWAHNVAVAPGIRSSGRFRARPTEEEWEGRHVTTAVDDLVQTSGGFFGG